MSDPLNLKGYEIPTCTICLEELITDLAAAECGHVFHHACVLTSLKGKSQCPNCRDRSRNANVRPLTYSINVIKNDRERTEFLGSLCLADHEKYVELISKNDEMSKENQKLKKEIAETKDDISQKQAVGTSQAVMIKALQKEAEEEKKNNDDLRMQFDFINHRNQKYENQVLEVRSKNREQAKELADYEKAKSFKSQHHKEDKYFKSLMEKASIKDQADTFYETLLMKKAEQNSVMQEIEKLKLENKELIQATKTLKENLSQKDKELVSMKQKAPRPKEKELLSLKANPPLSLSDKLESKAKNESNFSFFAEETVRKIVKLNGVKTHTANNASNTITQDSNPLLERSDNLVETSNSANLEHSLKRKNTVPLKDLLEAQGTLTRIKKNQAEESQLQRMIDNASRKQVTISPFLK